MYDQYSNTCTPVVVSVGSTWTKVASANLKRVSLIITTPPSVAVCYLALSSTILSGSLTPSSGAYTCSVYAEDQWSDSIWKGDVYMVASSGTVSVKVTELL